MKVQWSPKQHAKYGLHNVLTCYTALKFLPKVNRPTLLVSQSVCAMVCSVPLPLNEKKFRGWGGTVEKDEFLVNTKIITAHWNEEVRRRAGIERELASKVDQKVLRWFGHVERMEEYRMARRVLMVEVSGGRV